MSSQWAGGRIDPADGRHRPSPDPGLTQSRASGLKGVLMSQEGKRDPQSDGQWEKVKVISNIADIAARLWELFAKR